MNHQQHQQVSAETVLFRAAKIFAAAFRLSALVLILTGIGGAQTATWRYVTTLPGRVKIYLNDEIKVLPDKNPLRWEKTLKPDTSAAIALVEWNCAAKLRLPRQIVFYDIDQSVIATKKRGFEWTPIVPGSAADFLYRRVCSTVVLPTAEITTATAGLRDFPDDAAPISKTAERGDRFQIAPESGQKDWFNVINPATQADYWLTGDALIIVKAETANSRRAAAAKEKSQLNKIPAKQRKIIRRVRH